MKICLTFVKISFLLFLVGLLVGCGGSGSGARITSKITIAWPTISREVSAPSYANSAQISISVASGPTGSTWFVDRPSGDAGQTVAYSSADKMNSGPAILQVRFFSGTAGNGLEVADAAVSVIVDDHGNLLNSSGGALGTISYGTTMSGFFIDRDHVGVDESKPVIVSGSFNGFIMAIPQSLATMEIVSNPEKASVSKNVITGLEEGTFEIKITVEGFQATVPMRTTPKLAVYNRAAFPATMIAYDTLHHKFWGTFGSGSIHSNSIVDIDPVSGVEGNPILVGGTPNWIAVSSDGSTAYVALNGASAIRKVNLNSRTAGQTIPISLQGSDVGVTSIDVNPSNPNEFAFCGFESGSSGFQGPVVIRDGVQVGGYPGLYTAYLAKYSSPTTITGVQLGISSGTLFNYSVGANSVDLLASHDTNDFQFGQLCLAGTKALVGKVIFDPSSLNVLGQLTYGPEIPNCITSDSDGNFAWGTMVGSISSDPIHIRQFDMTSYNVLASNDIEFPQGEGPTQVVRFGNSKLAILTNKAIYILTAPGL